MPAECVSRPGAARRHPAAIVLLLGVLLAPDSASAANPPTGPLSDITFGAGRYVAVGPAGRRFWSADGTAWQAGSPAQTNIYVAVTHTGSRFAALTDDGTLFESSDGAAWTRLGQVNASYGPTDLAYGAGRFVVVDESGSIFASTTGTDWTVAFEPSLNSYEYLYGVAYGGGKFVAVGVDNTSTKPYSVIRTSPDGLKWTRERHALNEDLRGVSFLDGQFACVGLASSTSADASLLLTQVPGLSWNRQTLPGDLTLQSIAQGQGITAAVGDGGAITVFDGTSWSRRSAGVPPPDLKAIAYGPAGFIAVGNVGLAVRSVDGQSWVSSSSLTGVDFTCVAAETSVVVGGCSLFDLGSLWISEGNGTWGNTWYEDGEGWGAEIHAVCRGVNLYAAAGFKEGEDSPGGLLLSSSDGRSWQLAPPTNGERFHGLTYGNGLFVAVGSREAANFTTYDTIRTSSDGKNWISRVPNTGADAFGLLAVTHGGGQFVAVGAIGTIILSFDGIHWEPIESGTFADLNAVTYAFSQYVTVGLGGTVLVSQDGEVWEPRSVGATRDLNAVVVHQGALYCAGAGGFMAKTTDLKSWSPVTSGVTNNLTGMASAGTTLWVVGEQGTILQLDTDPPLPAVLRVNVSTPPAKSIVLTIGGRPGSVHRLEACSAITPVPVWGVLQPVTIGPDGVTVLSLPREASAQFYRCVMP